MREQQEKKLIEMFRQMTERERQNGLAYFQQVVSGHERKRPELKLVANGRRTR